MGASNKRPYGAKDRKQFNNDTKFKMRQSDQSLILFFYSIIIMIAGLGFLIWKLYKKYKMQKS